MMAKPTEARLSAGIRYMREREESSRIRLDELLAAVPPDVRIEAERIAGEITAKWRDDSFVALSEAAEGGDLDAIREMHSELSVSSERDQLTPSMREFLAAAFDALARGASPEIIWLKKPGQGGRPNRGMRDSRIRWFVRTMKARANGQGETADMPGIYAYAALVFGLSEKSIRNIVANDPENGGIFPG